MAWLLTESQTRRQGFEGAALLSHKPENAAVTRTVCPLQSLEAAQAGDPLDFLSHHYSKPGLKGKGSAWLPEREVAALDGLVGLP